MAMDKMDIECLHLLQFKCRLKLYMIHSRTILRKAAKPVDRWTKSVVIFLVVNVASYFLTQIFSNLGIFVYWLQKLFKLSHFV